jgi:hypothetical protein
MTLLSHRLPSLRFSSVPLDNFPDISLMITNPNPSKHFTIYSSRVINKPVQVAARSKTRVYGQSLAGIAGLNPAGGMDLCLL